MWRSLSRSSIASSARRGQLRIDPAQGVVGAELEDHGLGAVGHRPVEPRKPAGGGVAGHPGIGDLGGDALRGEGLLELRRKRRIGRQAIAGGERIAESDDLQRPVGCRHARRRTRKHDGCEGQSCERDSCARDSCMRDSGDQAAHLPYLSAFPI